MIRNALPTAARGKLPRHRVIGTADRSFGTSPRRQDYDSTLKNLKIGSRTRVIFQGFTGKQATANARESIEWGTNIVGGVRPGYEGEHLGLPVLPTVRKAMEVLKPDATGIYVAAHQASAAIEEAIEAEVPLIVAVAEHIPLHDMIRIHAMLKSQSKSRLVGANSPGIISSVGKCRIGFQPLPCFEPGRVGIVARSGTLSYETAASTLRSGLGQSICIGVGGDTLPGTTLLDGLRTLVEDPDTEAIALVGEIGGEAEVEAADWIKEYRSRTHKPKPIAAIIGGTNAPSGRIMGHAGAFTLPGEPSAHDKVEALRAAGCAIVNHPSRFGLVLSGLLNNYFASGPGGGTAPSPMTVPIRGMHTYSARRSAANTLRNCGQKGRQNQKRSIHLKQSTAFDILRQRGIPVVEGASGEGCFLAVTLNRSTKSPCVLVAPTTTSDGDAKKKVKKFDFDYLSGVRDLDIDAIAAHLGLSTERHQISSLREIITGLVSLFKEKEAYLLEIHLATVTANNANADSSKPAPALAIVSANFGFDDAAYRSSKRQTYIQGLRDVSIENPFEVEAEKDGIVYIRLPDPEPGSRLYIHAQGQAQGENGEGKEGGKRVAANIGTLVNGAGLAMNTVDALADAGGMAANFLDTGGKATSETVKRSFELILTDERVKCVFVNIFGGLTLGDMIARGIVLAFRDLHMSVPVVVRIRGTNEKEGQKIIAESGLPLFAFDDFDEAAAKAIELANEGSVQRG